MNLQEIRVTKPMQNRIVHDGENKMQWLNGYHIITKILKLQLYNSFYKDSLLVLFCDLNSISNFYLLNIVIFLILIFYLKMSAPDHL